MTSSLPFPLWLDEQIDRRDDVGHFARELVAIVDDLPLRIGADELGDHLALLGVDADVRALLPAAWSAWLAISTPSTPERRDAPATAHTDDPDIALATAEQEADFRRLERRFGKDGLPL